MNEQRTQALSEIPEEAVQYPTCGTEIVIERPSRPMGPMTWLSGRSRRFWIGTALTPVLYVASFGLTVWLDRRREIPKWSEPPLRAIYLPILWAAQHGPQPVQSVIGSYIAFWKDAGP